MNYDDHSQQFTRQPIQDAALQIWVSNAASLPAVARHSDGTRITRWTRNLALACFHLPLAPGGSLGRISQRVYTRLHHRPLAQARNQITIWRGHQHAFARRVSIQPFPDGLCCPAGITRERQAKKQVEGRCSKQADSGLEFPTVEDDLARFGRLLDQPDMEVNL